MTVPAKKRGRPRAFDPDVVLGRATELFLRQGYAGASLEDLTRAMGLNKPSLYAAFGDKRELFMRAVRQLSTARGKRYQAAFERGDSLESAIAEMLDEAVDVNLGDAPPGCLVVNVSTTEALVDEELAKFTREFLSTTDRVLAQWIEAKYPPRGAVTSKTIAQMVNGIIHGISVRARAGESKAKLREYARAAAAALAKAAE